MKVVDGWLHYAESQREKGGEPAESNGPLQTSKNKEVRVSTTPSEPKFPASAYQMYVQENRPAMTGDLVEVARKLRTLWTEIGADGRQTFEDKAKVAKDQYEQDMATYKAGQIHALCSLE